MAKHRPEWMREAAATAVEEDAATSGTTPGADGDAVEATAEEVDTSEVRDEDLTAIMQRNEELEQLANESQDRYLRTLAEFDNFRKRQRQEMDDARRAGTERLAADLLAVLDNFERALQHTGDEDENDPVREGILLIHKQLQNTLAKHEIEPIEAIGRPFDPQFHEAIMRVEADPDHPPGTVAEELRKGYMISGRVLRASLVKVAGD